MILKAEGVARPPLLASSCGRAGGHLDGQRQEEGSRCPRFLKPLGTALGVCRALCRLWEVSPPGQDQATTPARAGRMLGALGRLLHTRKDGTRGRQGCNEEGDVAQ